MRIVEVPDVNLTLFTVEDLNECIGLLEAQDVGKPDDQKKWTVPLDLGK
jgi:hypothetical protein